MFICGIGSIANQVEQESNNSQCSTPKRPKKTISFCKKNTTTTTTKNPYADRGLDKFYALLADLDSKKQKIYTQKGSEDISFVRFVYTNESDNVRPIVVKVKDKKKSLTDQRSFKSVGDSEAQEKVVAPVLETPLAASPAPERRWKRRRCLIKSCNESFKLVDLKQPKFCLPVMVFLILVFLAMYGRSFAIMCTSIGWYLVPSIVGASNSASSSASDRKPKRKKEYVRKQSAPVKSAGPSSPKSVIYGLQQQHDRKKSW